MSQQITTITFFHYRGFINKVWAFGMMQFAHAPLANVPGLSFYKLMGSGKGFGFNPWPDWSTYCLLQVWESESKARQFFEHAELTKRYRARTENIRVFYMRNITSKGAWSGGNPFEVSESLDETNPKLGVITRATIRWSKLAKFWSYVPTSQKYLADAPGLIYTKGVGEAPIVQMATFSLWANKQALFDYAYRGKEHSKAIQMTRELDWYKEELFARFQVFGEEEIR
jgi:hypothetical protein